MPHHPARQQTSGVSPMPQDHERITLVVGGLTEGVERQSARETAQREQDEAMAQGGSRFRRFVRGMVRGNMLREYYLLRNRQQAELRIEDTGRLDDMNEAQWQTVQAESIQRIIDDEGTNELIHQQSGERRDILEGDRGVEIRGLMNRLLTDYVNGTIDRADLQEEARRQLAELARNDESIADLIGAGNIYMSNIVEIADVVRSQVTHERGIDQVLQQVDIVTSRLNTGVNTETRTTRVSRILDRIHDSGGIGSLVNHTNFTLGAAIFFGFGAWAGKGIINRVTRLGTFSAGAGLLAYHQEKMRLLHERAQVGREAAMSQDVDVTERRQRLAETLYDMRDATTLTEAMRAQRNTAGEYEITDQAGFDTLLAAALETSARMDLAAANRADYIRFSSRETVQQERREMMLERFRARTALRRYWDAHLATDPRFAGAGSFEDFFNNSIEAAQTGLVTNTTERDQDYRHLSRQYSLKRAGQAMLFGAAFGMVSSELFAHAGQRSGDSQGMIDALRDDNRSAGNKTVLGSAIDWLRHHNDAQSGTNTNTHGFASRSVGPNTVVNIDDRLSYTVIGNEATIHGPDNLTVANLGLNPDGTFSQAAQDKLRAAGLLITEHTEYFKGGSTTSTAEVPLKEYMNEHGTKVHRKWFDNDTKIFDKNELKLDLKTNANGDYVYDASRMIKGGSHHDGRQADMIFKNMKLLVSPEKGVQSTPIMLDVDARGQVVIPKGSPVAQFFEMRGGKPVFTGAYAEMAQVDSTAADGGLNVTMLATDVGEKQHFANVAVEKVVDGTIPQQTITIERIDPLLFTEGGGEGNADADIDFGAFPVTGRGGLRRNRERSRALSGNNRPPQSPGSNQNPNSAGESLFDRARRSWSERYERARRRNEQARHDRAAADRERARQESERRRAEEAARQRQQQQEDELAARRAAREQARQQAEEAARQRQEAADRARHQEAERQRAEQARGRQSGQSSQPQGNPNGQPSSPNLSPEQRAQDDPSYKQAIINLQQRTNEAKDAKRAYDQDSSIVNEERLRQARQAERLAKRAATRQYRKLVERFTDEDAASAA